MEVVHVVFSLSTSKAVFCHQHHHHHCTVCGSSGSTIISTHTQLKVFYYTTHNIKSLFLPRKRNLSLLLLLWHDSLLGGKNSSQKHAGYQKPRNNINFNKKNNIFVCFFGASTLHRNDHIVLCEKSNVRVYSTTITTTSTCFLFLWIFPFSCVFISP